MGKQQFDEKNAPEDSEKYLSITQVAKYRKIPADTLRYYDSIGLIKPNTLTAGTAEDIIPWSSASTSAR